MKFFFAKNLMLLALLLVPGVAFATITFTLNTTTNSDGSYNFELASAETNQPDFIWGCNPKCDLMISQTSFWVSNPFMTELIAGEKYALTPESEIVKLMIGKKINNVILDPTKDVVAPDGSRQAPIALYIGYYAANSLYYARHVGGLWFTLPQNQVKCKIIGNEFILNHGSLVADQIAGNTVSKLVNVTCNRPANAVITATGSNGGNLITLAPDLTALLKIDNVEGERGVAKNNLTDFNFVLSSTLQSSTHIAAGDYKGSGILKIEFQ